MEDDTSASLPARIFLGALGLVDAVTFYPGLRIAYFCLEQDAKHNSPDQYNPAHFKKMNDENRRRVTSLLKSAWKGDYRYTQEWSASRY